MYQNKLWWVGVRMFYNTAHLKMDKMQTKQKQTRVKYIATISRILKASVTVIRSLKPEIPLFFIL